MEGTLNKQQSTYSNLSYNSPEFDKIAQTIQGNILKGHGRNHATLIFFTFKPHKIKEAKAWLHHFGTKKMTTAAEQKAQSQQFKNNKLESFFYGLYLSSIAYDYLGISTNKPNDEQFISSMTASKEFLSDPSVSQWEATWQKPCHGSLLIAYDGRETLNKEADNIMSEIAPFADCFCEKGDGLKNEHGLNIEHFGYVDGISQPHFFLEELSDKHPNSLSFWNPMASLDLVLTPDGFGSWGSYWIFRKLEQDVVTFKKDEANRALERGLEGEKAEIVGAEIIGRFESGMPLVLSSSEDTIDGIKFSPKEISEINNFNYTNSDACPMHAHIRKTNQRTPNFPRIVRRGITYGARSQESLQNPIEHPPTEGVGLLFQSFQSRIREQFETIQKEANSTQKDIIIGCPDTNKYVKLKGGGYFFAPSLLFFRTLNNNNMTKVPTKGIVGNFPNATSRTPVYYAKMVSHAILEQLRNDIEAIVQTELTLEGESGTPKQVIQILTSRRSDLMDLFRKIDKIHTWYNQTHPKASEILKSKGLKEGKGFEFTPNDYHKPSKSKNGKVPGTVLVQCADGLCCSGGQAGYRAFMVPNSFTEIENAELEHITEDGKWHIFEAREGETINIELDGVSYTFTI